MPHALAALEKNTNIAMGSWYNSRAFFLGTKNFSLVHRKGPCLFVQLFQSFLGKDFFFCKRFIFLAIKLENVVAKNRRIL